MSVFFNGRLLTSPTVASKVDDSAMANRNLTVGNVLAILGTSTGGKPNTELRFGSPSEALAVLKSGPLAEAVVKAFDPSAETGAPSSVIAIRVNPATQSTLNLADGSSNTVIALTSTDYGLSSAQIKVKIENGTTVGKKLTTQLGNDYYTQDNVARNLLSVQYTGAEATGVMTISDSSMVLQAPSGTTVATLAFSTYDNVQNLVDRINAITGFTASVLDGNGEKATAAKLDLVTAQNIKSSAYTVTGNLQAVVDWFNGQAEGFVTATRQAGAASLPANIGFTYLSGGTEGTTTNTEWQNAFTTLQSSDVQWLTPLSYNSAIHAMADAHAQFMSTTGKMERRAVCGTASGTSDADAISAAKALNSERSSLVHIGSYDYNLSGDLVLFEPYHTAAIIAAGFAGSSPGTAMTNKSLKIRGVERKLRNPTDTDALINGGVLCIEDTPTGYRVVKSITTWLTNDNFNRVEVSCGAALDFTVRNVRQAVAGIVGAKGNPVTLALAASITDSTLRELARPEPSGPGVLAGDDENPAYRNISVTLEGDVLRIEFECAPVIPVNYVLVTVYAKPYSGAATA